jgi:drug/metabolite transporter (DMT)-like permease
MPDAAPPRRLDPLGVAGAVLCCALWGGNAVAVKYSVPTLPAFGCAALRFAISLPVIAAVCRGSGQPLRVPRPLWGLLGAHALLTVVQIGTFNLGTSLGLAGRSSVFINVHPLVVAPLAWLVFGERMGWRALLGLGAAAAGVLLLLSGSFRGGYDDRFAGDLIVLGSGVVFGAQSIAQKKTFPLIPPATLLFGQSVLAIPLFLAYSAAFEGLANYHFTPESVGGVLYQGLIVSGVCFTTWMLLLRRYPAGRLAALAFVTPLFGVGFGHLTRGEPLTWRLLAGGLAVGCGIYLVASDRTAHGQPPALALPGEDAP